MVFRVEAAAAALIFGSAVPMGGASVGSLSGEMEKVASG